MTLKKFYFHLQSLQTTTWISVHSRADLLFVSSTRRDVFGDFYATHVVFEADSWEGANSLRIPNEEVSDFIRKNGLRLVGVRLGWTGWQGELDHASKKELTAACKDAFKDTGWSLLELAESSEVYKKYMRV